MARFHELAPRILYGDPVREERGVGAHLPTRGAEQVNVMIERFIFVALSS
jgi:hypothetical protein